MTWVLHPLYGQLHPILNSHIIGGKAVVPLALIAEWICHGALHENPGLLVHGLDDIRILKGIRFDADKKRVRLLAGKIRAHDDGYAVDVELRNGFQEGRDILHCRAKAVLAENLTSPPPVNLRALLEDNGYNRSASEIYTDILFHGHQLHGIQAVTSCSPAGTGTYHGAVVLVLATLWGYSYNTTVSYAIVNHIITFSPVVAFGVSYLLRGDINIFAVAEKAGASKAQENET